MVPETESVIDIDIDIDAEIDIEAKAARSYPIVADVNVRSGPGTSYRKVGRLSAGSRVTIACQKPGETVTGPTGTSKIWDRIGSGRYVSDTYVRTGSSGYVAPRC
ncbi:SH3 domain-containing protein [Streptomyces venezuelae]|uniref:SH3 domain-containing protein n=2 Tax=Streptomyces venezuelae TaxID=54571 RepID=A0A5P2CE80_STRVZ|nr:SH3 domain-containing protein [Streptomyces venezuelae]QES39079.1 SH3 domain-containing protein [Streptomyces venezuelae]